MLAHVRRLKDEVKFVEASRCLSDWQLQALQRIRQAGGSKEPSGKAKKAKTAASESEEGEELKVAKV